MEKFLFIFIHLALPVLLTTDYLIRKPKTKINLVTRSFLYIAILNFLFFWGQWPLVGSFYLRYLLVLFLLLILYKSVSRFSKLNKVRPSGIFKISILSLTALLLILVLYMNASLFQGRTYPQGGTELQFPLKNGVYYVASGGGTKIINNHMRDYPNSQEYALDINKLGKFGSASKRLFSSINTDHHIFGEKIYSPCNGVVIETQDSIKDNLSGSMKVSDKDGTGNFVNIKCEGDVFVFIPHMKQNSVLVRENLEVKKGTPIGSIGISGFAQEPHLHIQAAIYNNDSLLVGIPLRFEGRRLIRNQLFRSQSF